MRLLPILLFASALCSQTVPGSVRASGEATVTAQPDEAQVSIGVITQAATAEDATAQNAATTTRVLDAVKRIIHSKGELKTTEYSVTPTYKYANNTSPAITGYEANNIVLVTIDDLSLLGKVLDTASNAGSNRINGVQFMLRDDSPVRTRALAEAASKARANGEAIANALHLHVTGVTQAEASENTPIRPMPAPMVRMNAMAVATPIESNSAVSVHASVTVTLAVQNY
ncbi:MAG TPA: SIMPL domain-containing protein [Bryobacteraceae bacterium]|jgi:hypothetical protein|nr:SIMPL domain-containing protein [Bryobacteraceae bacterium]